MEFLKKHANGQWTLLEKGDIPDRAFNPRPPDRPAVSMDLAAPAGVEPTVTHFADPAKTQPLPPGGAPDYSRLRHATAEFRAKGKTGAHPADAFVSPALTFAKLGAYPEHHKDLFHGLVSAVPRPDADPSRAGVDLARQMIAHAGTHGTSGSDKIMLPRLNSGSADLFVRAQDPKTGENSLAVGATGGPVRGLFVNAALDRGQGAGFARSTSPNTKAHEHFHAVAANLRGSVGADDTKALLAHHVQQLRPVVLEVIKANIKAVNDADVEAGRRPSYPPERLDEEILSRATDLANRPEVKEPKKMTRDELDDFQEREAHRKSMANMREKANDITPYDVRAIGVKHRADEAHRRTREAAEAYRREAAETVGKAESDRIDTKPAGQTPDEIAEFKDRFRRNMSELGRHQRAERAKRAPAPKPAAEPTRIATRADRVD